MSFGVLAFLAGMLTILAPCVMPLLPVVLGGSITGRSWWRPLIVVGSFLFTVILVTAGVKLFADRIMIPAGVWKFFSAVIIFCFGLVLLFPVVWGRISAFFSLQTRSMGLLTQFLAKRSFVGLIFLGMILAPVFVSCSPTYFLILSVVLPQQFGLGMWYLFLYVLGISLVLFGIGFLGQRVYLALEKIASPHGVFKRLVGGVLILFSILIITGYQTKLEAWILDQGWYGVTNFEFEAVDEFKIR